MNFDLDIEELERLCDKHDLLLSEPLFALVTDIIVMVLNKKENENEY